MVFGGGITVTPENIHSVHVPLKTSSLDLPPLRSRKSKKVVNTCIIVPFNINYLYIMQDLFVCKVRQFRFEIQKLFGSSKPFSCDVIVCHTDQITVLPIEMS